MFRYLAAYYQQRRGGATKHIVIAVGGNALLNPSGGQSLSRENKNMQRVSGSIASLYKTGRYSIAITHGNGSQVGDEIERNEHAKAHVPKLPLYELNAETQATIGTVIATSLRNSLSKTKVKCDVCVILAHVIVDTRDRAFRRPTKQVGPFCTREELRRELRLDRFSYIARGDKYRMVVPSPEPLRILEIKQITSAAKNGIVVTCGGGGIPSAVSGGMIRGINAVIDKDLTSQLLATSMGADTLVILTNAECVYRDFGDMGSRIAKMAAKEAKKLLPKLEEGTMRPKVEACIRFIESGGKEAYIGNIFMLDDILRRKSGTMIC